MKKKKGAIADKWLDRTFMTYPSETFTFLGREKDRFANPVGHTLSEGIRGIVDVLIDGTDLSEIGSHLEAIIKIRSVQGLSSSKAVSFIFLLKKVIWEELKKDSKNPSVVKELLNLDTRIDEVALLAFDVYVSCREKLYEIRVNEVKRSVSQILKKTDYLSSDLDFNPESTTRQHVMPVPKVRR
ncbi:MAG: hypothetical protein GY847_02840 [Proteobacteria bacterium]|nr:hypothetical protein [Pseudomonadota bacterium]